MFGLRNGTSPGQVANLRLDDGATISVRSGGGADAGRIDIYTETSLRMTGGSSLTTEALAADGGNITIRQGSLLDLQDSTITATVDGAQNTVGGNIDIRGDNVVLASSSIVAKAKAGSGGFIFINATGLFVDSASEISASSELGVSGIVEVDATEVDLIGNLAQLSESFLDVSGMLAEQCTAVTAPAGSLVVRKRVPLWSSPDDPLQSFPLGY